MIRLSSCLSLLCLCLAISQNASAQQSEPEYLTSPATTVLNRPFSEAVRVGNMLYLSGFTGRIPGTNTVVPGGIQAETKQVMENIKGILEASGVNLNHVVKTTVFLKDMSDFATMNEVYAKSFAAAPPARSTVQVARLPKDALVEIEVIASL